MKKFAPIAAIALFAMAFTSCKKDYTCSCTLAGNTPYSYTLTKAKKSDAKTWCDTWNTTVKAGGGTGCTLK